MLSEELLCTCPTAFTSHTQSTKLDGLAGTATSSAIFLQKPSM